MVSFQKRLLLVLLLACLWGCVRANASPAVPCPFERLTEAERAQAQSFSSSLGALLALGNGTHVVGGRTYKVEFRTIRGMVESPFEDKKKTSTMVSVVEIGSGKKIYFPDLAVGWLGQRGYYADGITHEALASMFPPDSVHSAKSPMPGILSDPGPGPTIDKNPGPPEPVSFQRPPAIEGFPAQNSIQIPTPNSRYVAGGHNSTAAVRAVTEINGIPIAQLESVMRPGKSSEGGFLGKTESLLEVMAKDNAFVVDRHGLSHSVIADTLGAMEAVGQRSRTGKISVGGMAYQISVKSHRGDQESPFSDGTKSNTEVTVRNLSLGVEVTYSGLLKDLVRYGFYEGEGTSYRLSPEKILEVMPFLKTVPRR